MGIGRGRLVGEGVCEGKCGCKCVGAGGEVKRGIPGVGFMMCVWRF